MYNYKKRRVIMKLSQILQGIECQKINFLDVDIEYLSNSTIDIR